LISSRFLSLNIEKSTSAALLYLHLSRFFHIYFAVSLKLINFVSERMIHHELSDISGRELNRTYPILAENLKFNIKYVVVDF